MKKQLLATTALAAAGAIALSGTALAQDKKMMKPSLTIKGAYEQNVGFVDSDVDGEEGFHTTSDNEIAFSVRSELDNGLIVRGEVELEGNTSSDQIDEAFVAVGGSFGEIRMGANDEAAYEMTFGYHGSVSTGTGNYTLEFDVGDWLPNSNGLSAASVRVNRSSDSDLIAYYTPRFSGFQFGASYARRGTVGDEDTDTIENNNDATDRDGAPASNLLNPIVPELGWDMVEYGNVPIREDNDVVSLAANYVGKFGGVGVGIAVGYVTADVPGVRSTQLVADPAAVAAVMPDANDQMMGVQAPTANAAGGTVVAEALNAAGGENNREQTFDLGDRESWGGGIRLDFSGIRLGVGYVRFQETTGRVGDAGEGVAAAAIAALPDRTMDNMDNLDAFIAAVNGRDAKPILIYESRERERWDVGARYTMGPHSFRIGYINVSEDDSSLETSAGVLTYARTLGPGVTWSVDALWADYQAADGDSTDGSAITTGIKIKF